ncbi:hypothetical protein NEOLEDRAFT_1152463 [Neolentinus lepideus HHB14362 ss-1]|uniref:Uncharacterized protein n=1 Tax=Neolentinus lepideus HHB14362 ss-1 TaxID=1314782 RepID=A0A165MS61_9AGAM|nr:hypothetical protein NEOLEDRAFT_1152463 [Neolentinus lepideus HHB14362 ss-1]
MSQRRRPTKSRRLAQRRRRGTDRLDRDAQSGSSKVEPGLAATVITSESSGRSADMAMAKTKIKDRKRIRRPGVRTQPIAGRRLGTKEGRSNGNRREWKKMREAPSGGQWIELDVDASTEHIRRGMKPLTRTWRKESKKTGVDGIELRKKTTVTSWVYAYLVEDDEESSSQNQKNQYRRTGRKQNAEGINVDKQESQRIGRQDVLAAGLPIYVV